MAGDGYLVVGTTFYSNMITGEWHWIPFPMPMEEDLKHMRDFRIEYLGEEPEQEATIYQPSNAKTIVTFH